MNENKANYAKIGFFVVAGLTLIIGCLVLFGFIGTGTHEVLAETYFNEAVSGMDVGSVVTFRGVRVGQVKAIGFVRSEYREFFGKGRSNSEDARKVFVQMAFEPRAFSILNTANHTPEEVLEGMVRHGLRAYVAASGVTGLSHLELNYPQIPVEIQSVAWEPHTVYIPSGVSTIQNIAASATSIMHQIDQIDIVDFWTNTLAAVRSLNTKLDAVDMTTLNAESVATMRNLNAITQEIREAMPALLVQADTVMTNSNAAISHAAASVAQSLSAVNQLASSQQNALAEVVENLRVTTAAMRETMERVQANPSTLLFSKPPAPLPETGTRAQ